MYKDNQTITKIYTTSCLLDDRSALISAQLKEVGLYILFRNYLDRVAEMVSRR